MNHRSLIASLSSEQRNSLTRKSDLRGFAHLALHWGGILGLGWLIIERVPFWPLLVLMQGVLIIFLFTLLHETIHLTVFETPWVNRAVARTCGFLILLPSEWFRYFHFAHHRHTQDPEKDPELAVPKPGILREYLIHMSGLPVWYSQIKTIVRNALGRCENTFVPNSGRTKVRKEAQLMIIAYALTVGVAVTSGSAELLYVWILPAVLGQPFLRLYLPAEHGRCPQVANMLENSRTTFTNGLMRKLAWNMPYHAEHHTYPSVPFHRLSELHELTRPHLRETENGYIRFHRQYLAGLRQDSNQHPPTDLKRITGDF